MSLKRQGKKQSKEEKNVAVETDTKTDTIHATNARGKTQGDSLPSEDIYGAKDPDQDCDMVTALDRDALTPTELKFLEAARTNRCNILTSILARPNFNVNVRTNLNRTALHMAASQGHLEAVQLLVKAKCSIDAVDKHGMTPLFWAAFRDHVDVVLYLLESGAGPQRRTKRGYSLLHVVAKADAIKTMEALLRRGIITNLCEYDNNDMTPLMIAASSGSVLSTTVLSKLGHIEDHVDQHQRNLLHMAVLSGSSEVVAVLCQNPASAALINEFDEDGMTPLQYAVRELNYDCVEILLAHGAKPNIKSPKATFPIIMAAQKGDVEMVRILISGKARIKKKNRSGNTPLHVASMANHVGVVMELLQVGADIEVRNKRLQPPLIAAVEQNSAEATEVLLLSGADMNKVDAAAKTALTLAAQSGFARIVDLLIKTDRFRTKHPPFAAKFQPLLYHLAYKKLKKEDWKKLAVFWGFTDDQIAAIELHHSQSSKAYKDHGFRMLSIWLHGVEANETPTEGLSAALIAIGEKSRAEKLQQDYHKVLHGHKSWKDRLDVSSRLRR
nr:unnamed protein product [Spirometra erinaceieuropaei]